MKCPRCRHENRPSAKFCEQCAAALAGSCARCGSPLPEKARFCPECAHPLEERAGKGAVPAGAEPAVPEGERRQASVLFADISGYTRLCTSMDAEHVQALLNRFYASMDTTVAAYGGNVIDHAGDGVLAVFGAPVAYGNDPERALRAGLAMQAAAAQLNDPSGNPLALHIGIASGEVVAAVISGGATPKYTVTGDTVNLAARLDALAQAGQTVLSESVYASVASLVDAEDLGEKSVKGFDRPTRVYSVRAMRHNAVERPPFVGRKTELRQIAGLLESARESGTGVAVAIRGDPGIGKSRLVEELCWRARAQGYAWHIGRVLDFGVGKGQEALPSVVAAILGLPAQAQEPVRGEALRKAIESGLLGGGHEALVCALLDLHQRDDQQAVFDATILDAMDNATRVRRTAEAVADLVDNAARAQPQLIVFEDIHWGSKLLMACLASLTMTTRTSPLVLAMTTRFEGDPLDRQWRAATHGTPLLTIDMGPLRPEEARTLAGDLLESSSRFALECIERAEGNPLFLEQLLRNARESAVGSVPPTIQSLVLARIDRLSARDKLALQAASVIGKHFTLEGLRALVEDDGYRCDALVAADLVRPDGGDYLFAHALIQEGVYSSLLHSRKRELHAKAAEWYGAREPVVRAEHLDRAQHPDAARACLLAAEEEMGRLRYDSALRLAERGWALASEDDRELRHALAMRRGDLLHEIARTQESLAAFEQALQAARDDAQRCRAWMGIAGVHRVTGAIAQAADALEQAQPIAERLELWSACSRIHMTRGNLHFAAGKVSACGAEHQLALDYGRRAGDVECEALALSGLGDHAYAQGRMHTALRHFQRCVELSRQAGLVRVEIPNLCMFGHCLGWTGEGDAGLKEVRRAADLSHRIGLAQTEVMALESVAFKLTFRGELEEAEVWAERATAAARQAGARRYLAIDHLLMAVCRRAQGRIEEGRALVAEAFELCRQIGMGFLGSSVYAFMAQLAEDRAERRRLLQQGEALLDAGCLAHARLMYYRDAIEVALEDESWGEVLRYAGALEEFTRPEPLRFAELVVARARALVALGRGEAGSELVAELTALRGRLVYAGIGGLVPRIDAALAARRA
jgi:class 3 adenylate cyclase/tetratricopeptide (TPR) repeat protein